MFKKRILNYDLMKYTLVRVRSVGYQTIRGSQFHGGEREMLHTGGRHTLSIDNVTTEDDSWMTLMERRDVLLLASLYPHVDELWKEKKRNRIIPRRGLTLCNISISCNFLGDGLYVCVLRQFAPL